MRCPTRASVARYARRGELGTLVGLAGVLLLVGAVLTTGRGWSPSGIPPTWWGASGVLVGASLAAVGSLTVTRARRAAGLVRPQETCGCPRCIHALWCAWGLLGIGRDRRAVLLTRVEAAGVGPADARWVLAVDRRLDGRHPESGDTDGQLLELVVPVGGAVLVLGGALAARLAAAAARLGLANATVPNDGVVLAELAGPLLGPLTATEALAVARASWQDPVG